MLTRDRTSEVLVAGNAGYTIQLFFAGKTPGIEKDTLVVTPTALIGDERISVEVVASKDNLYRFRSQETAHNIRMVLCLLDRHEADIYDALSW